MISTTNWKPIEKTWGDRAYRETVDAFSEQIKSRAVALSVWSYAQNPDMSADDLEATAQDDPEIKASKNGGKKVSRQAQVRARKLLGLETGSEKKTSAKDSKKGSKLSKVEKAILAKFQESTAHIDDFVRTSKELALVREAFEKARQALLAIPRDHARMIAEADPEAARIFVSVGVLSEPETTAGTSKSQGIPGLSEVAKGTTTLKSTDDSEWSEWLGGLDGSKVSEAFDAPKNPGESEGSEDPKNSETPEYDDSWVVDDDPVATWPESK